MKMKYAFFILALLLSASAISQEKSKYLYGHISDKSVTLTPFYKVFGSNFDPAITIGGEHELYKKGSTTVFHNLEGTWYSHALTGGGLSLSSSIGVRPKISSGLYSELALGLIGSGFISGRETFVLNDDGRYEQSTPLHFVFGVPIDLSLGYDFGRYSVYCRYRYQVEGKYTGILPMIPSSMLGIGLRYGI